MSVCRCGKGGAWILTTNGTVKVAKHGTGNIDSEKVCLKVSVGRGIGGGGGMVTIGIREETHTGDETDFNVESAERKESEYKCEYEEEEEDT